MLVVLFLLFQLTRATSSRPNVLFIGVDDLRPEIAGNYGQTQIITPNLERLANRSTTFLKAYCQVALCSPSRTSLLTGLRPDTTGVWTIGPYFRQTMGMDAGNAVVTLPQYFKQNGYTTTGVGKIFHPGTSSGGPSSGEGGGDGGYPFRTNGSWSKPYFFCDQFYNGTFQSPAAQQWPGSDAMGCVQSSSCLTCLRDAGGLTKHSKPAFLAAPCPDSCFPDGAVADEAVRQIEAYGVGKDLENAPPFFLAVGFKRPHLGWFAPKKYFDVYANNTDVVVAKHRFPPNAMPSCAFSGNGEMCGMDGVECAITNGSGTVHGYNLVVEHQHLELRRAYYSTVTFMDAQLGKVLDALDRSGLQDNTIVVFWGDHGYQLGEHGEWAKITNFEDATRVPLLISLPHSVTNAQRDGQVQKTSDALVELLDVYPTLVEAAGLPPRGNKTQGKSLMPLINGTGAAHLFNASFSQITRIHQAHQGKMGISMRTEKYRYTEWLDFDGTHVAKIKATASLPELYTHKNENINDFDGTENVNLAADKQYANVIKKMHQELAMVWGGNR